jgi:hypothetical protein
MALSFWIRPLFFVGVPRKLGRVFRVGRRGRGPRSADAGTAATTEETQLQLIRWKRTRSLWISFGRSVFGRIFQLCKDSLGFKSTFRPKFHIVCFMKQFRANYLSIIFGWNDFINLLLRLFLHEWRVCKLHYTILKTVTAARSSLYVSSLPLELMGHEIVSCRL